MVVASSKTPTPSGLNEEKLIKVRHSALAEIVQQQHQDHDVENNNRPELHLKRDFPILVAKAPLPCESSRPTANDIPDV